MRHPQNAGRLRALRGAATAVAAAVLLAGTAPAALAVKDRSAFPSQDQVDRAKARVERKAAGVAGIKAELAAANRRLEQAGLAAEQAAEAYNGAMWRLQEAQATLTKARAAAKKAQHAVVAQRDGIGAMAAQAYVSGGDLASVEAFINLDGTEAVMRRYQAYHGASNSMEAAYQRFQVASDLADAFARQAEGAQQAQERAAKAAKLARDDAAAAAENAQAVSDEVLARKQELVRELARAQGISVRLAQQRQDALARIAAAKAAREARRKAAAAAAAAAAAQAAAEAKKNQDHPEAPAPTPDPPSPGSGAAGAIAFAKAQLGEPYVWAATGPDAWDCSGLTMRAWEAGGVSLPHYSAAQYAAGTPISVGDLRPGDLVFWGTTNDPSSIHHVALYLGDGMIIHAPRTGRPVSIDSMYYWIPPNFFARP